MKQKITMTMIKEEKLRITDKQLVGIHTAYLTKKPFKFKGLSYLVNSFNFYSLKQNGKIQNKYSITLHEIKSGITKK